MSAKSRNDLHVNGRDGATVVDVVLSGVCPGANVVEGGVHMSESGPSDVTAHSHLHVEECIVLLGTCRIVGASRRWRWRD